MEIHTKKVLGASGSRRFVVYTHNGAGEDGVPYVIHDTVSGNWGVENEGKPLKKEDEDLVLEAIADMQARRLAVEAAIASERYG